MHELQTSTDQGPRLPPFDNDDDQPEDAPARGAREGLPKDYRSRHERHYVEQLAAPPDSQPVRLIALDRLDAMDAPGEETVADLAASIAELGILQPLLVRPQGGRFKVMAGRRRLTAARKAGLTEAPCLVHSVSESRALEISHADNLRAEEPMSTPSNAAPPRTFEPAIDVRTTATLEELQQTIVGLQTTLQMFAPGPRSTRERVALRLLAVETERAAWLVRAHQYLVSAPPLAHRAHNGAALLDQARRMAATDIALRGGTVHADPVDTAITINGDRTLLTTAITGLAGALFALGEAVQDPRVLLRLAVVKSVPVLTITQPTGVLSETALSRFFDPGWSARPGGTPSELAALLARHAAQVHRAHLEVSSGAGVGTTVTITFS